jgi:hypothetical protein
LKSSLVLRSPDGARTGIFLTRVRITSRREGGFWILSGGFDR